SARARTRWRTTSSTRNWWAATCSATASSRASPAGRRSTACAARRTRWRRWPSGWSTTCTTCRTGRWPSTSRSSSTRSSPASSTTTRIERCRMTRILVTGINHAPENIGIGKYTGEMCRWLAARGHQVRMVAAPPYYPAWRVWPGHRRWWFRREQLDGVDVIRCPLWVPRTPRGATRLLHLVSFGLSSACALAYSLAWRPQVVVNVAPTLTSAPAAWALARLSGARCWLHIQDFELDAALNMGIVDAGPARRVAVALERWLLRRFDTVSTISGRMLERL